MSQLAFMEAKTTHSQRQNQKPRMAISRREGGCGRRAGKVSDRNAYVLRDY